MKKGDVLRAVPLDDDTIEYDLEVMERDPRTKLYRDGMAKLRIIAARQRSPLVCGGCLQRRPAGNGNGNGNGRGVRE